MTATFNLSRDQVIKMAMQVIGALSRGQSPDATDLSDCSLFLGAMIKQWSVEKGFNAWCYENISWPCVAAQPSYTIGESAANVTNERPLKIAQAWTVGVSGDIQPLTQQTREQFNRLSPRNAPGPTTCYYYDPQLIRGIFNIWPVPTDTSRSFTASIIRPIGDIVAGGDTFDVPQEGLLALVWGLAELIMPVYGTEEMTQRRIEKNAPRFLEGYMDFNQEDGSIIFQPTYSGK